MTNGWRARLTPTWGRLSAALAFALPLVLYIATLAPGVLNDDPGEYQLVLGALGVAHPTGYPLYTLVGYLFTRLAPIGEIAWRVNLFSAVAGALACLALFALLRELDVDRVIAVLAALLFAVSGDVWFYATVAQTYALNSLLIALALWMFVRWRRRRDARSFGLLGLTAGIGAAHHSTFWLTLPAMALGAAWLLIEQRREHHGLEAVGGWRGILAAIVLFLLPLSLYLYIPIRGEQLLGTMQGDVLGIPHAVVSGMLTPHYLPGWTNVALGSFYAGSTLEGASVDWGEALGRYAISFLTNVGGLALLCAGAVIPSLWRKHGALLIVLLSAWLTNVIVVMRGVAAFNEPAGGLYTPTVLFGMVLASLVSQRLFEATGSDPGAYVLGVVFAILSAAVALAVGASAHGNVARIFYPERPTAARFDSYSRWANGLLSRDLAPSAVVLGNWSQVTPLHYVQQIDGQRRDVAVIQAPLSSPDGRDFGMRVLRAGKPLYLLEPDYALLSVSTIDLPLAAMKTNRAFGDVFVLEGYRAGSDVRDDSGQMSRRLQLYFRARNQPDADYKIFVRCVREDKVENCSHDRYLGGEYWHTSLWEKDRLYEHPAIVWDFRGEVEIGIYHPDTLKRLPLPDGTTTVRIAWP